MDLEWISISLANRTINTDKTTCSGKAPEQHDQLMWLCGYVVDSLLALNEETMAQVRTVFRTSFRTDYPADGIGTVQYQADVRRDNL